MKKLSIKKYFNNLLEYSYFPHVISFFLIMPSLIWIFSDKSVWPWDPAWYGEVSVDLYYKMFHSPLEWPKAMLSAFGTKAPGIAWFGQFFVPLSGFTGSIDRAIMMQIMLAQFLSLVLIYLIILRLTKENRLLAVFGSLVTASAPLFIGMGHQYFVESLQLLAVTAFIYILVNMDRWDIFNSTILLIVVLSYAMLVKATSPLYIIFPGILFIYFIIKKVSINSARAYFRKRKHQYFYLFGSVFFLSVAGWYVVNGHRIMDFMKLASSGSAELYGARRPLYDKFIFWIASFQKSFFFPQVAVIIVVTVGLYVLLEIFINKNRLSSQRLIIFFISFLSITAVLVSFSLQTNEETRYLLPLFPYVVIIICLSLYGIGKVWINYAALLVFFIQFIFLHSAMLGWANIDGSKISSWSVPANANDAQKKDIDMIIERTCTKESYGKISMIGVEFPWLNANSVEYYAVQHRLRSDIPCYYTSLGYAEKDEGKAWRRLTEQIKPPYVVTTSEVAPSGAGAFNLVSAPMIQRVEKSGLFEEKKYPNERYIRIFKNKSE